MGLVQFITSFIEGPVQFISYIDGSVQFITSYIEGTV